VSVELAVHASDALGAKAPDGQSSFGSLLSETVIGPGIVTLPELVTT
jgi:hypothetical protein